MIDKDPVAFRVYDGDGNYDYYDIEDDDLEMFYKHLGENCKDWLEFLYLQ